MYTTTPTRLRKELFHELKMVLRGVPVRIRGRGGNAVMVSEALYRSGVGKRARRGADQPKIAGRIVGDRRLLDADERLRAHLELPE